LRNNYDKLVFNGSVGTVTARCVEEGELRVQMEDREAGEEVRYGFDELDELAHAYAPSASIARRAANIPAS
jgi:exodeoxyribonuclease V alpha subunit